MAVANVIGKEYYKMIHLMLDGHIEEAREIHFKMLPVVRALFIESNPTPAKEAMNMMGVPAGKLRLPLVPLRPENRETLRKGLSASWPLERMKEKLKDPQSPSAVESLAGGPWAAGFRSRPPGSPSGRGGTGFHLQGWPVG